MSFAERCEQQVVEYRQHLAEAEPEGVRNGPRYWMQGGEEQDVAESVRDATPTQGTVRPFRRTVIVQAGLVALKA